MKKVLVATCVVAMTAFGITNASADPMATARANAYGVDVGGSLLSGLVERTPEANSVLPPGGRQIEDIITVPADPLTINGTGVVVAETSAESTIVPLMRDPSAPSPTPGGVGGVGDIGSITDTLTNLLGGLGGGGLPVGALQAGDAGTVQAQQVPGLPELPGGGLLDSLLGGGGATPDGGTPPANGTIEFPVVNAHGFARIDDLTLVPENLDALAVLDPALQAVLAEGLLGVDVISAEAAVVCSGNVPFFDTAASVVGLNNEPLTAIDEVLTTITETIGAVVPEEFVNVSIGETGVTADGTGFFVNALHVTILGVPEVPAVPAVPDGTTPTIPEVTVPTVPLGAAAADGSDGAVQIQQVPELPGLGEGGGPLLDIVIGHAEVSGAVCAAPPPTTFPPTGDDRPPLPRTGGLGVLPSLLGVGLLGGALTAGRFALRARRNGDSL